MSPMARTAAQSLHLWNQRSAIYPRSLHHHPPCPHRHLSTFSQLAFILRKKVQLVFSRVVYQTDWGANECHFKSERSLDLISQREAGQSPRQAEPSGHRNRMSGQPASGERETERESHKHSRYLLLQCRDRLLCLCLMAWLLKLNSGSAVFISWRRCLV